MTMRQRKLFGGVALVAGLTLYIILVSAFVPALVAGQVWLELLLYAVAGVAWAFPVRSLVLWMNKPDD
ncbi:MAG: DUF2842 domain-containing protein [Alphaproteobacteria bacterium]